MFGGAASVSHASVSESPQTKGNSTKSSPTSLLMPAYDATGEGTLTDFKRRRDTLEMLAHLSANRFPFAVPLLQPYDDLAEVPSVALLQRGFARTPGTHAAVVSGPTTFKYSYYNGAGAGDTAEMAAEMSIDQAPASVALPLIPHQPFLLPFKVSLKLATNAPHEIPVTLRACLVSCAGVTNLDCWAPPSLPDPRLLGSEVHTVMKLTDCGLGTHNRVFAARHEFVFNSLQFTESNKGEPLFLVFYALVPFPGVDLYNQFMLPAIVCEADNTAEQAAAAELLWYGALPPRPPPMLRSNAWSFHEFCGYVTNMLRDSLHLERPVSPVDLIAMAHRAGFFVASEPAFSRGPFPCTGNHPVAPVVCGGPTTQEEIDGILTYIHRTQALLKVLREQYEQIEPQIICGFGVGRNEAESLLGGQPPGTFLLRFGFEAGTLVKSVVALDGTLRHVKIGLGQMQYVSLAEIISLSEDAKYLLDPVSGLRYPREMVLNRGYECDTNVEMLAMSRIAASERPTTSDVASTNPSCSDGVVQVQARQRSVAGDQLPDQGLFQEEGVGQSMEDVEETSGMQRLRTQLHDLPMQSD